VNLLTCIIIINVGTEKRGYGMFEEMLQHAFIFWRDYDVQLCCGTCDFCATNPTNFGHHHESDPPRFKCKIFVFHYSLIRVFLE